MIILYFWEPKCAKKVKSINLYNEIINASSITLKKREY